MIFKRVTQNSDLKALKNLEMVMNLRSKFNSDRVKDIELNLKCQPTSIERGKVDEMVLTLKNYHMKKPKPMAPDAPRNPYLKRNFKSVQRKKQTAGPKYKNFKLFN